MSGYCRIRWSFCTWLVAICLAIGASASAEETKPAVQLGPVDDDGDTTPSNLVVGGVARFTGRVRDLAVTPDGTTAWAATASGGIWFSNNISSAAPSWTQRSQLTRTFAFSSIAISPKNSKVMYAGSGELHTTLHLGANNGVIEKGADAGLGLRAPRRGFGIFKSIDAGATWLELGATTSNKNFFFVNRIAPHPNDLATVTAATATGLFISNDGGQTWRIATGTDSSGATVSLTGTFLDVRQHPLSPFEVVASDLSGAIWTTSDLSQPFQRATLPAGVPASATARAVLAPVPAASRTWLVAMIQRVAGRDPEIAVSLLRSIDQGRTFAARSNPAFLPCSNNRFYSGALHASANGTQVLFGGITLCRSSDGGITFAEAAETTQMHNDYHALVPVSGGMLLATDGGVFRMAAPPATGGVVAANGGLVVHQATSASRSPDGSVVASFQDVGTLVLGTDGIWRELFGGSAGSDGMQTAADPTDSQRIYFGKSIARLYRLRSDGGKQCIVGGVAALLLDALSDNSCPIPGSSSRCVGPTPILLDRANARQMYVGCRSLWRTRNARAKPSALAWQVIRPPGTNPDMVVTTMAQSPTDSRVMVIGTAVIRGGHPVFGDAGAGEIWITDDVQDDVVGATDWARLDAPNLPKRPVSSVAIHPSGVDRIYAAFTGWTSLNFNNVSQNLYRGSKQSDGSYAFTDISTGLPGGPVHAVAVSPTGKIAAATEFGVRVSRDDGATWSLLGQRVPVGGLSWTTDNQILAATYGRGVVTLSAP